MQYSISHSYSRPHAHYTPMQAFYCINAFWICVCARLCNCHQQWRFLCQKSIWFKLVCIVQCRITIVHTHTQIWIEMMVHFVRIAKFTGIKSRILKIAMPFTGMCHSQQTPPPAYCVNRCACCYHKYNGINSKAVHNKCCRMSIQLDTLLWAVLFFVVSDSISKFQLYIRTMCMQLLFTLSMTEIYSRVASNSIRKQNRLFQFNRKEWAKRERESEKSERSCNSKAHSILLFQSIDVCNWIYPKTLQYVKKTLRSNFQQQHRW